MVKDGFRIRIKCRFGLWWQVLKLDSDRGESKGGIWKVVKVWIRLMVTGWIKIMVNPLVPGDFFF